MGWFKLCTTYDDGPEDTKNIKIKEQDEEIILLRAHLKKQIERTREAEKDWALKIDEFVENWFEENKDDVDIGVIHVGPFTIDIFPDFLEKYIYKKFLKIAYSFLTTRT
tara:strand:+ start:1147 stop:1473 length:327 start_codon:yes stop_codon:yes gene_type:complete